MKSKIKTAFEMFELLFSGIYDPLQFSLDMEQFLFDNYEIMMEENAEVTKRLNNDVPELCAEGEPNFDPTHMIEGLKIEYERAKALYEAK